MSIARLASRTCPDAKLVQFLFKELLAGGVTIARVFTETAVMGIALSRGLGIAAMPLLGFIILILLLLCETVGGPIVVMHGTWQSLPMR
jgi:hypothetical protein